MRKDLQLIENVLHKKCYPISKKLHAIFINYSLIQTPAEARKMAFVGSSLSELSQCTSLIVQHTLHTFFASIALFDVKPESIEFLRVDEQLDVDIISEAHNGKVEFKINDRNLKSEYVHQFLAPCEAYSLTQQADTGSSEEALICDCSVKNLFTVFVAEFEQHENFQRPKKFYEGLQDNLLSQMPRDFQFQSEASGETNKSALTLSWNVNESEKFIKGFEVLVWRTQNMDRSIRLLLHDDDDINPIETTINQGISHPIILSVEGPKKLTCFHDLEQGAKYTAVTRAKRKKSFYSLPFVFVCPLRPPWNVNALVTEETVDIGWKYENSASTFVVRLYSSSKNQISIAEVVGQLTYSFQVNNLQFSELRYIGIRAISAEGIESEETFFSLNTTETNHSIEPSEELTDTVVSS